MKQRFLAVVFGAAAMCVSIPAGAQTRVPGASGPLVNLWYAGAFTGPSAVQAFGPVLGAEVGIRAGHNLDLVAEGGWFQNAVSKSTFAAAGPIVAYLQATQGKAVSSKVKAPTTFATAGARWVFEGGGLRPYVIVAVGGARVEIKSTFAIDGADATSTIAQKGVTLGQDLTGRSSHPAVTAGGGVLKAFGGCYLDVGYRLTSIVTTGQATNVNRLNVGFGIRY